MVKKFGWLCPRWNYQISRQYFPSDSMREVLKGHIQSGSQVPSSGLISQQTLLCMNVSWSFLCLPCLITSSIHAPLHCFSWMPTLHDARIQILKSHFIHTLTSYFWEAYMSLYNSTYAIDLDFGLAKIFFSSGLNLNSAFILKQAQM